MLEGAAAFLVAWVRPIAASGWRFCTILPLAVTFSMAAEVPDFAAALVVTVSAGLVFVAVFRDVAVVFAAFGRDVTAAFTAVGRDATG